MTLYDLWPYLLHGGHPQHGLLPALVVVGLAVFVLASALVISHFQR
ncbi:MAG: hypothetical protein WD939_08475 [Dehalococcoidia bacterium]